MPDYYRSNSLVFRFEPEYKQPSALTRQGSGDMLLACPRHLA